ncbi:Nitroreductase [Candidatus Zixiibacteriota bacterium]|nr:Nitroreductase [candidate division Zixibacteria bacterium]
MEFFEVIKKRRSIRAYKVGKVIPDEILFRILESARLAPSASNLQPWKFIIIRDSRLKTDIAKLCKGRMWIADASAVIAGVATRPDYRMGSGQEAFRIDIATAFAHMTLTANNESLGCCWIGSFSADECKKLLGIPDQYPLVGFLTVGYPDEIPGPKERKSMEEIVCYDRWAE